MKFVVVIFIGLLFVSCAQEKLSPIYTQILINLAEGEIKSEHGYDLLLKLETEKIYPCKDYLIITEENIGAKKIKLKIVDIQRGNPCSDTISTAKEIINLGVLENGSYKMNFEIAPNNEKIKGSLEVSEERYIIEIPESTGIDILNTDLIRKK